MKPSRQVALAPVMLLPYLLLVHIPAAVRAQEDSLASGGSEVIGELTSEEQSEHAAKLITSIRASVDAALRYQELLSNASREDSLVLGRQITVLSARALEELHELTDVLVRLEKTEPQPTLRAGVVESFESITPHLWTRIDRLRREIDATRARRSDAAPEERLNLEYEVSIRTERLDRIYKLAKVHIDKLEMLGLDAAEQRSLLSESLSERAAELSGRLDLALMRIKNLTGLRRDLPDDATIPVLLAAAKKSRATNTASLGTTLTLMEAYQLRTDDYRAQLIAATADLSTGITNRDAMLSLVKHTASRMTGWLTDRGPQLLTKLLVFVIILAVFNFAARLVRRGVERALSASKLNVSQLLRRTIVKAASNLVLLLGLLIALSQVGVSLGPVLAGLGVAGFIVGFALQDSLANFAAGMMILLYRPYDVGDLVEVAGAFGLVETMSLVSTSIKTFDNQVLVVPNGKIWGDVIKNVTAKSTRRVDMVFGISYSDDIPKAEQVLLEILEAHDKTLAEPAPVVRVHNLGDSSVDFIARPWVRTEDYWEVYWDVTRTVKMRFDAEGISIPFPQRDIHVYEEEETPR
jgi:small conductance mechanosensitive channel